MKKIFSTLVLGVSIVGAAATGYADNQFYLNLGAGYAAAENMPAASTFSDIDGVLPLGTDGKTEDNYGGRFAVGYMWDTESAFSYGVETAAAYYGVTKYSNSEASVDMNYYGLELLAVGQVNIDKLRLIGKVGATDERFHPTKTNIEDNPEFTSSQQVLPEVGAGIAYLFTPNFQLGLSYYHTFGNDVSFDNNASATNLPSVDLVLLEMSYFL